MSAPARVSVSRALAASPSLVYAMLADYREHHPRILPKPEFESLVVEKGGVGAGTVIRVDMNVMGARSSMRMEVSEPEPGRVLAERDVATGATTRFVVEPAPEGSLVTIQTEWPARRGLRGVVERLVNPRVARGLYARELALLDAYARERVTSS